MGWEHTWRTIGDTDTMHRLSALAPPRTASQYSSMLAALLLLAACSPDGTTSPAAPPDVAQQVDAPAFGTYPTDLFHRPFSATSRWNTPITGYSNVTWASTSAMSGFGTFFSTWSKSGWSSVSQATDADPLVTLYFNYDAWRNVKSGAWKRSGNSAAVEKQIRASSDQAWRSYQGNQYSTTDPSGYKMPAVFHKRTDPYWSLKARVPANALPTPNADGHMTIFQPNGWVLETYATIKLSNGDLVSIFASYTDGRGDGTGAANGRRAAMIPNYAGLIRNGEISSGQISHAMALILGPEALAKAVVWPAAAMDRSPSNYTGSLPMGTMLAIKPTVDVNSLGLSTTAGKIIAKAAQTYGFVVVDRGGSKAFHVATEQQAADVPGSSSGLKSDLAKIRDRLSIVKVGARN